MAGFDYSPLRLSTSIEAAKRVFDPQLGDPTLFRHNQILLRPNEAYFQVTNFNVNYAFTSVTGVFVYDPCTEQTYEVTSDTVSEVLIDSNDIPQIAYEVGFLDLDFYSKTVHLVVRTDTQTFYSTPFNLSNAYNNQYVRLEYGYYGMSFELGIDFSHEALTGKAQTIGLRAHYSDIETNRTDKGYTQMSTGLEVTGKALDTTFFKFLIEYSKPYDLIWLSRVLSADWINIGWGETLPTIYRVTNKPAQKAGDIIGSSNLKQNEFSACIDLSESRVWIPQSLDPFEVTARYVEPGYYTSVDFQALTAGLVFLEFNRDIAIVYPSFQIKIFKDGALILTTPINGIGTDGESYIQVAGNVIQLSFSQDLFGSGDPSGNGTYDFVVEPLYDEFGSEWAGYGIGEWRVILADAHYDSAYYDSTKYLTD
jgi:hypothetical protein